MQTNNKQNTPGLYHICAVSWREMIAAEDAGYEVRDTFYVAGDLPKTVAIYRVPLEGTLVNNLTQHGVGALNIDACRQTPTSEAKPRKLSEASVGRPVSTKNTATKFGLHAISDRGGSTKGRWPTNFVLMHLPSCELQGVKRVKAISGGTTPRSRGYAGNWPNVPAEHNGGVGDSDGMESILDYHCASGCPAKSLNQAAPNASRFFNQFSTHGKFEAWCDMLVAPNKLVEKEK